MTMDCGGVEVVACVLGRSHRIGVGNQEKFSKGGETFGIQKLEENWLITLSTHKKWVSNTQETSSALLQT